MKLNGAIDLFKTLSQDTTSKSELKIYQRFIMILSSLIKRDLTEEEVNAIELKLDALDLSADTDKRKKHIKKGLNTFTTYLNKEFSLVTEGYYTSIGLVYGMLFGTGIGVALGTAFRAGTGTAIGLSMGTGVGMVFGIVYGNMQDAEAKKQNRVLV